MLAALRLAISGAKEHKLMVSREEIFKIYAERLEKLNSEANQFYALLGELENLAKIIQGERFTFASIQAIRERPDVKRIVSTLKERVAKLEKL